MNLETVYSFINISVMPAWVLLIFVSGWKWTDKLVQAAFIPLLLAIRYAYFIGWGMFFGGAAEGAGMSSLALTFMFGPLGLALYLLVRWARGHGSSLAET